MGVHSSASGLADQVGEQDNQVEKLVRCFAELGGYSLLWIKSKLL